MKKIITASVLTLLFGACAVTANAQSTSYWSQCPDNTTIARCETYNCPKGDTNGDGRCTLSDDSAQFTESRNDSFCANPQSGCGEVLYFAQSQQASCAVRVKESENNCNLYKASSPNFGTTATAAPVSRLSTSPVPTNKPVKSLPKTGPELWMSILLAGLGIWGFYLYEKKSGDEE